MVNKNYKKTQKKQKKQKQKHDNRSLSKALARHDTGHVLERNITCCVDIGNGRDDRDDR